MAPLIAVLAETEYVTRLNRPDLKKKNPPGGLYHGNDENGTKPDCPRKLILVS